MGRGLGPVPYCLRPTATAHTCSCAIGPRDQNAFWKKVSLLYTFIPSGLSNRYVDSGLEPRASSQSRAASHNVFGPRPQLTLVAVRWGHKTSGVLVLRTMTQDFPGLFHGVGPQRSGLCPISGSAPPVLGPSQQLFLELFDGATRLLGPKINSLQAVRWGPHAVVGPCLRFIPYHLESGVGSGWRRA